MTIIKSVTLHTIRLLFLLCFCQLSFASFEQFCFSYANTFYEQLYCELHAEGKNNSLPSFYDFQNNNEFMQYLLLKPKARYLSVRLSKPQHNQGISTPDALAQNDHDVGSNKALKSNKPKQQCIWHQDIIACSQQRYALQLNVKNTNLAEDVLSESNLMRLPKINFDAKDLNQSQRYLQSAYQQYLQKMIDIGLAGVTLSYQKFKGLFHELEARNIDFVARFETMYFYLKQDKKMMSVSTKKVLPKALDMAQCYRSKKYMACASKRNNYVFELTE